MGTACPMPFDLNQLPELDGDDHGASFMDGMLPPNSTRVWPEVFVSQTPMSFGLAINVNLDDFEIGLEQGQVVGATTSTNRFVCSCGSILSSNLNYFRDHILLHRCSPKHRKLRGTYVVGEDTTVELFFNNATCHCGESMTPQSMQPRIIRMMMHLQSPSHLLRMHDKMDEFGIGASLHSSCVLCYRHQQSSPVKSLVWSFDEIRQSYQNVVECVAHRLLKFEPVRFGRANTSLADIMVPDPDQLIPFDPAYILYSAWRHKSLHLGVTEEQIFAGMMRIRFPFFPFFEILSPLFLCKFHVFSVFCLFVCIF